MSQPRSTPALLEVAAALLVPAAAYGFIRVFDAPSAIVPKVNPRISFSSSKPSRVEDQGSPQYTDTGAWAATVKLVDSGRSRDDVPT